MRWLGSRKCCLHQRATMNGIHDMGGMQDMGPIHYEKGEPVFYEQWFSGLVELLVRTGLVSAAEIESGVPAPGSARATPPLTADMIPDTLANRLHANRDVQ